MRAHELLSEIPLVGLNWHAIEAVRVLAERCVPGLIVVDDHERPLTVLSACDALRLVVPAYAHDSANAARLIDERHADLFLEEVGERTVGECLVRRPFELPLVEADATALQIAALMTRKSCPVVAVIDQSGRLLGGVTINSLLSRMFTS